LYHVMLALPLYSLGEWDDALAEIEAGLALADELGSGAGRMMALALRADILVHRGELPAADDALVEARGIVERLGPQWGMGRLTRAEAQARAAAGEPAAALAILDEGWKAALAGTWVEGVLSLGPALARVAAQAGDHELAQTVAAAMEEPAKRADVPFATGGALLCRALADTDADVALRAIVAYRPSGRAPDLAAACEDTGRLLAREGDTAEARNLFDEALAIYERLGAVRDSARTLASMRELGLGRKRRGARKRPERGWESLTPSELEVVRLAAQGLTNREIGQRLFISRRTAETHLRHVFNKLGLSSRVELAAEAARRGSV
jgi:DNA-binding CsgD family transcriptional regulator/tetratricopeptide (TPR) repeat protein